MTNGGSRLIKKTKVKSKTINILSRPKTLEMPETIDKTQSTETETEKPINTIERERIISFQRTMFSPVRIIGTQEELVPFAWRNTLDFSKQKHLSKHLKNLFAQKEKQKREREKKATEGQIN